MAERIESVRAWAIVDDDGNIAPDLIYADEDRAREAAWILGGALLCVEIRPVPDTTEGER